MNVCIIMMQKNEDRLLEAWLKYHGTLFGYKNIYLIDNASDSPITKSIIAKYEKMGINLIGNFTTHNDFIEKGNIVGNIINQLDKKNHFDFYFPLDCDEFLAVQYRDGTVTCDIDLITKELSNYKSAKSPLLIKHHLLNWIHEKGMFFSQPQKKIFFNKGTFKSIDHGFHNGSTLDGECPLSTNIIYVHFHKKPYELIRKHAKLKMKGMTNNIRRENVISYKGPGLHLNSIFLESEREYLFSFYENTPIYVKSVVDKFHDLDVEWPYLSYEKKSKDIIDTFRRDAQSIGLSTNFIDIGSDKTYKKINFVEGFEIVSDYIRVSGWSVSENIKKSKFYLVSDNFIIPAEEVNVLDRPDVVSHFKADMDVDVKCGFELFFSAGKLKNKLLKSLNIFCSDDDGDIGYEMTLSDPAYKNIQSLIINGIFDDAFYGVVDELIIFDHMVLSRGWFFGSNISDKDDLYLYADGIEYKSVVFCKYSRQDIVKAYMKSPSKAGFNVVFVVDDLELESVVDLKILIRNNSGDLKAVLVPQP